MIRRWLRVLSCCPFQHLLVNGSGSSAIQLHPGSGGFAHGTLHLVGNLFVQNRFIYRHAFRRRRGGCSGQSAFLAAVQCTRLRPRQHGRSTDTRPIVDRSSLEKTNSTTGNRQWSCAMELLPQVIITWARSAGSGESCGVAFSRNMAIARLGVISSNQFDVSRPAMFPLLE